jgi:Mce-associated membrane protein
MPPTDPGTPRRRRVAGERARGRTPAAAPSQSVATAPPPGTGPVPPPPPPASGPRTWHLPQWRTPALPAQGWLLPVASAVVAALVAVTILLALHAAHGSALADARKQAKKSAVTAVTAALSYDYRTFDSDVAHAGKLLTPKFRASYTDEQDRAVKTTALRYQASSAADVIGAGVVSATTDSASVLLFVDQTARNSRLAAPRIDKSRVIAHMVKDHGRWLCSSITPI